MAHTPGPWVWRWKSGTLHQVGTVTTYGQTVLSPSYEYDSGIDTVVSAADAALIAASPDLLAALKLFVSAEDDWNARDGQFDDPLTDAYNAARAAITKAEG
jgi:hypothetical protein